MASSYQKLQKFKQALRDDLPLRWAADDQWIVDKARKEYAQERAAQGDPIMEQQQLSLQTETKTTNARN